MISAARNTSRCSITNARAARVSKAQTRKPHHILASDDTITSWKIHARVQYGRASNRVRAAQPCNCASDVYDLTTVQKTLRPCVTIQSCPGGRMLYHYHLPNRPTIQRSVVRFGKCGSSAGPAHSFPGHSFDRCRWHPPNGLKWSFGRLRSTRFEAAG